MASDESRKRERSPVGGGGTGSATKQLGGGSKYDEWWHSDEFDAGSMAVEVVGDGLGLDGELMQARRATTKPTAQTAQARHQRSHRDTMEDTWRQLQANAAGTSATLELSNFMDDDKKAVELVYNRDCKPPFLTVSGAFFSRQQKLVLPIKDDESDFAVNARKGSQALRDAKAARERKKTIREALKTEDSDMDRVVRGDIASSTADADRLAIQRRKERLRNASEEERVAIEKELEQEERRQLKQRAVFSSAVGARGGSSTDADEEAAGAIRSMELKVRSQELVPVRRSLPIYAKRDELLRLVRENDVSVVVGETGSGKTTQIVQYLYEAGYADHGVIGCTQPRRMATVSVAERVAEEVGSGVGQTVGYTIRLEDRSSEDTKIRFMTEGVLLQEVLHDPDLSKYSVIVIDEAHERSVNTDVLLGVLRDVQRRRTNFKLLVTSATMDIDKFSMFFGGAPQFCVSGRMYHVDVEYEKTPVADYVETAVFKVIETHMRKPTGDILVFMTGKEDVDSTCELIRERLEAVGPAFVESLLILPCYSTLPSATQRKIQEPAPPNVRKCIVATNVAETSLTIDGVVYVVDTGYMKTNVYKPNLGMNTLQVYPVSQAQAKQRSGRAGRTQEGVCVRLYSERQFDEELLPVTVPEIQRSSVDSVVLLLKSIGVKDLLSFDFIDPPPEENLRNSMMHLWMLGALNSDGDLTEEGRCMADLPAEPAMAKALIAATKLNCAEEMLCIISMMAVDAKSIFLLPPGREQQAINAREKFFNPESDHLTLLNIVQQFRSHGQSLRWAEEHYLNGPTLNRALDNRLQFKEKLHYTLKLPIRSCEGDLDVVRKALAMSYFCQTAKRKSWAEYTTMLNSVPCFLHPTSALNTAGTTADYVIYNDFLLTTKQYMSVVTAVDPEWLIEASQGVFTAIGDEHSAQKALVAKSMHAAKVAVDRSDAAAQAIPTREYGLQKRQADLAKKKRPTRGL